MSCPEGNATCNGGHHLPNFNQSIFTFSDPPAARTAALGGLRSRSMSGVFTNHTKLEEQIILKSFEFPVMACSPLDESVASAVFGVTDGSTRTLDPMSFYLEAHKEAKLFQEFLTHHSTRAVWLVRQNKQLLNILPISFRFSYNTFQPFEHRSNMGLPGSLYRKVIAQVILCLAMCSCFRCAFRLSTIQEDAEPELMKITDETPRILIKSDEAKRNEIVDAVLQAAKQGDGVIIKVEPNLEHFEYRLVPGVIREVLLRLPVQDHRELDTTGALIEDIHEFILEKVQTSFAIECAVAFRDGLKLLSRKLRPTSSKIRGRIQPTIITIKQHLATLKRKVADEAREKSFLMNM
ncbi:hypothetical protein PTTG_27000 [Puccinia triticina 1-1 BBBD Race 1]|uniref:Uncharacterized protein n=2 Tax=Puccinia triticina TaxID=208348 RepID=A0A180GP83_PUCT1|nr:uncharacterized protein PtA15_13A179 [Puccinia triticina]OAV94361.1 hypothetical protein PTTG_27000 [Puccinia triticina 1-1 BBBD Race 1]WAQ90780.1 hypothetical protein PtA15_13A179 [Puccinia triticina]WAR60966.1 hypothetical protein PtB15_13B217 [Puccinia triticina]